MGVPRKRTTQNKITVPLPPDIAEIFFAYIQAQRRSIASAGCISSKWAYWLRRRGLRSRGASPHVTLLQRIHHDRLTERRQFPAWRDGERPRVMIQFGSLGVEAILHHVVVHIAQSLPLEDLFSYHTIVIAPASIAHEIGILHNIGVQSPDAETCA